MAEFIKNLKSYVPWNEQEEHDKAVMLHLLETQKDIFMRDNNGNRQATRYNLIYIYFHKAKARKTT